MLVWFCCLAAVLWHRPQQTFKNPTLLISFPAPPQLKDLRELLDDAASSRTYTFGVSKRFLKN